MQQKNSTTVIRCAQSLVMDGITAHVKMDSLLTKMGIHAMVGCVCECVCVVCVCVTVCVVCVCHCVCAWLCMCTVYI